MCIILQKCLVNIVLSLFASLQRTSDEKGALEPKNELSASYMHYFRSPREDMDLQCRPVGLCTNVFKYYSLRVQINRI